MGGIMSLEGIKAKQKKLFIESYLQSMGNAAQPEDIDGLLVDCEVGFLQHHFGPLSLLAVIDSSGGQAQVAKWKKSTEKAKLLIEKIRTKGSDERAKVLEHG